MLNSDICRPKLGSRTFLSVRNSGIMHIHAKCLIKPARSYVSQSVFPMCVSDVTGWSCEDHYSDGSNSEELNTELLIPIPFYLKLTSGFASVVAPAWSSCYSIYYQIWKSYWHPMDKAYLIPYNTRIAKLNCKSNGFKFCP